MAAGLSDPVPFAAALSLLLLGLAMLVAFWRLVRGPSLLDRVVALDLIAAIVLGIIAAYSVLHAQPMVLDVAGVLALTAFLGTVAIARFLEGRQR
ncbi:MAG: monovalent cation/H+ antiporter complex subunit F [Bacteroidota bacterium]|jgi:multicomponent Na+:H+ antiporter subunit F|nr:monovalent cation/H+ antiporter complex subunit F [Bacteroidota bacterium]